MSATADLKVVAVAAGIPLSSAYCLVVLLVASGFFFSSILLRVGGTKEDKGISLKLLPLTKRIQRVPEKKDRLENLGIPRRRFTS